MSTPYQIPPPQKPNRFMTKIEYEPSKDFYHITYNIDVVKSVFCTKDQQMFDHFNNKRYKMIFHDYDSEKHEVFYSHEQKSFVLYEKSNHQSQIPNGIYMAGVDNTHGGFLRPYHPPELDHYINFGTKTHLLFKDIENFFSEPVKKIYLESFGSHRRGALVYGPPGNGKTHEIMNIMSHFKDDLMVIILTDENMFRGYFEQFRQTIGDSKNVIFVLEEVSEYSTSGTHSWCLPRLLSFLDGEESWGNTYIIGTTNYPEKLSENLVLRPGRFDLQIFVDLPNPESRKIYFEHKGLVVSEEEIELTKDCSVAFLKEIALRCLLKKQSIKETVVELNKDFKHARNHFLKDDRVVGFGNILNGN